MANAIKKNIKVLAEQAGKARAAIELDILVGKAKWRRGDRLSAIHTFLLGPPAEITEHMHRWVFYCLMAWGAWKVYYLLI